MRKRRRKLRAGNGSPEIGLTPLIDTALTLLMIFMITAPVVQNSIKIDLPRGSAKEAGKQAEQPLIVEVDAQGKLFFNQQAVTMDTVGGAIKSYLALHPSKQQQRIWVKIDRNKSCDVLLGVIDKIKVVAGIKDVAIALEQPTTALT